jgi:ribosomal protein S12 methylthiotransferase accessory factor
VKKTLEPYFELLFRNYTKFGSQEQGKYPYFLTTVDYSDNRFDGDMFEYKLLEKYSTNSGTAVGRTFEEAALHALNEVIERDALSFFQYNVFFKGRIDRYSQIQNESLPAKLKSICEMVEATTESALHIFDITSEFQIPTFLALLINESQSRNFWGCGTSLCKEYALERSLLEVLQNYDLFTNVGSEDFFARERKISHLRKHRNAYLMKIEDLNSVRCKNFSEVYRHTIPDRLVDLLRITVQMIREKSIEPYYAINYQSGLLTCIHVILPGTEKFFLTTAGMPVIPTQRVKQGYKDE